MFSRSLIILAISAVFSTVASAGNNQQSHTGADNNQQQMQSQTTDSTNMPSSPHQTQALAEIENRFKQMDIDGDGQISKDEGAANDDLTAKWADLDSDQSDTLSQDEFTVHQQEVLAMETESHFNELDSNADGQLSQEEARQHSDLSQKWTDLDGDANGTLSQEEFSMFQDAADDKAQ